MVPIVLCVDGTASDVRGCLDIAIFRFEKFGTGAFFCWPGNGGGVAFLTPAEAPPATGGAAIR